MGEYCRVMVLFQNLPKNIEKFFLNFKNIVGISPPTSYAYSFNAESLAKY